MALKLAVRGCFLASQSPSELVDDDLVDAGAWFNHPRIQMHVHVNHFDALVYHAYLLKTNLYI